MDKKNKTDYTGLEYEIADQCNRSDEEMLIDWVPYAVKEEFNVKDKLEQLNSLADDKVAFLEVSTNEVDEVVKQLKEIIEA